jgi:hypothetical protein
MIQLVDSHGFTPRKDFVDTHITLLGLGRRINPFFPKLSGS